MLSLLQGDIPDDGAFGDTPARVGDVDGDGTPDLMVCAWAGGPDFVVLPYSAIHSGRDGRLQTSITAEHPNVGMGALNAVTGLLGRSRWTATCTPSSST